MQTRWVIGSLYINGKVSKKISNKKILYNVTSYSKQMSWYNSSTLLEILEKLPTISSLQEDNVLQVQHVLRPKTEQHHDYRGFAGKVNSGSFQVGDKILVYPPPIYENILHIFLMLCYQF